MTPITNITISVDGDATGIGIGSRIGQEIVLPVLVKVLEEIDPADRLRLYAGLLAVLTGSLHAHLGPKPAQTLLQLLLGNLVQLAEDDRRAVH